MVRFYLAIHLGATKRTRNSIISLAYQILVMDFTHTVLIYLSPFISITKTGANCMCFTYKVLPIQSPLNSDSSSLQTLAYIIMRATLTYHVTCAGAIVCNYFKRSIYHLH